MEIKNEVKNKNHEEKQKFEHRSLAEIQRRKLEKLMKNPDKPVVIPEKRKSDKEYVAPSFVRNVMGSSAGAGSGEFHVYRHLRRKEYARQKHMKQLSETERLDLQFQEKLENNLKKVEDKTAKNRAKRQKKKKNKFNKGKKPKLDEQKEEESEDKTDDDEEKTDDEASEKSETEQKNDDTKADKSETDEKPTNEPKEENKE